MNNSFLDFIIHTSKQNDNALFVEFKDKMAEVKDVPELQKWFEEKKFSVPDEECKKLIDNKDSLYNLKENMVKSSY